MIKTVISDMSLMFDSTIKMVSAFKESDLAFSCEELFYDEQIKKVVSELKIEIKKAKKHGN